MKNFSEGWKSAISDKHFLVQAALTIIILLTLGAITMDFFEYIQARPGKFINDPVLRRIPPKNLSVYTFVLLYTSLVFAFSQLLGKPRLLIQALQIYSLTITIRIITLYLVPLEPSPGMIPLSDPLVNYFIYQKHMISKDLFFSGHVSTVFLAALMVPGKWQKIFLGLATVSIAVMILVQHVHYTIDVLAAPFFTLASYYIVRKLYEHKLIGG